MRNPICYIYDANTTSLAGFKLVQKRVDALMSVDIVRMTTGKQIFRVILVSEDSDLVPAVNSAKNAGAEVYLWYGRTSNCFVHDELLEACDERRELTQSFIDSGAIHTR